MENVTTRVRILGPKLFHHNMLRVRINGRKWLYDGNTDCFMGEDGKVVEKKDMPVLVQLGFNLAWENNKLILHWRYSHRHSYGWKLFIGDLHAEGRDIVVASRGRRMGLARLVDGTDNPPGEIPILPVVV